jgi:hypothetical protein
MEMPGLPQLWKSLSGLPQLLGKLYSSFPQSFGKAKKKLFHIPTKPSFFIENMIYLSGNSNCRQREKVIVADQFSLLISFPDFLSYTNSTDQIKKSFRH